MITFIDTLLVRSPGSREDFLLTAFYHKHIEIDVVENEIKRVGGDTISKLM